MSDFFLLIDNTYIPYLYQDTEKELKKCNKIIDELNIKEKRIKSAFVDGIVEEIELKDWIVNTFLDSFYKDRFFIFNWC